VHNDGRGHLRRLSGGDVPDGAQQIVTELRAVGGNVWTVALTIDGDERAVLEDVPLLYGIAPMEGIDIGIDRRSPVSWELYERFGAFPWAGTIRRLAIEPGALAPDSPMSMIDVLREMGRKFE
jgi:arylsulfatase